MEKEESGIKIKDDSLRKTHNAIRCAKAAMLLLSLGNFQEQHEKEMMNHTIEDLRMELVKERFNRRNLKLCNLMEFTLQIALLFSLSTFFLMLAFNFW